MAATLFTSAKEPNPRYKTIDNDHYDLDSCVIRLPPGAPLVAAVERFTVPASLETQLHLTHTQLPDGALVISGQWRHLLADVLDARSTFGEFFLK